MSGRRRWLKQLPKGDEDGLQIHVVFADLAFQNLDLARWDRMVGEHLAEMQESSHDPT